MVVTTDRHDEVHDEQGWPWGRENARVSRDSGTGTIAMDSHPEVSESPGYSFSARSDRVFEGTESPDDSIMPPANRASQNFYQSKQSNNSA